jgi:hypothetical protein
LDPLDTIVPAVAVGTTFALLTGALWANVTADRARKVRVKSFVMEFLRFYLILIFATVIYYVPSDFTGELGIWLYNNPSKLLSLVLYIIAGAVLYRMLRRAWH